MRTIIITIQDGEQFIVGVHKRQSSELSPSTESERLVQHILLKCIRASLSHLDELVPELAGAFKTITHITRDPKPTTDNPTQPPNQ